MDQETAVVDPSAPASMRVTRTVPDGPRSYRQSATLDGKLVIEIGATRSLWLLIALVIAGTTLTTLALIYGGNLGAACFLMVFGGLSAGVLGLLRGRGEVELAFSSEVVKVATRTWLAPPGFVELRLGEVRHLHVMRNDAGYSVSAELLQGARVPIVDELLDQRTARYLADLLAEEAERARARVLTEPGPTLPEDRAADR